MKISNLSTYSNKVTFKGYDAIPLKGFYMQGLTETVEQNIFNEIKTIAKKENLELYLNLNNKKILKSMPEFFEKDLTLSIWAQDNKAFVENSSGKQILWNLKEKKLPPSELSVLGSYETNIAQFMPRGGDYYLGYKGNNEKWLLINGYHVANQKSFEQFGDEPTEDILRQIFEIKPENIFKLNVFGTDLDEIVRPIGFPYILVNDYSKSATMLNKMKEAYPEANESYDLMSDYIKNKIKSEKALKLDPDYICKKLEEYGFKPIRIGASFSRAINFINAIALKNNDNKITYITNSTKHSSPELEYLEELFDKELRKNVENIEHTYYVSGGINNEKQNKDIDIFSEILSMHSMPKENGIMNILANRHGGIHCMTAEIPNFDKII